MFHTARATARSPHPGRIHPFAVALLLILFGCDALTETDASMTPAELPAVRVDALPGGFAAASDALSGCIPGTQDSGAHYIFCPPALQGGDVIIYNHGYQAPPGPPSLSQETFEIAALAVGLGYGFAATSFSKSGLAIVPGLADVVDLIGILRTTYGVSGDILVAGASEGGLITTLLAERYPELIAGALPVCGPTGDFARQINYFGDFRVLFDYFFPRILPGSPVDIPPALQSDWETVFAPAVVAAITADPGATEELLTVSRAPIDPNDPSSVAETVLGILWYNVFATNDAKAVLGGQPFDNTRRLYVGSENDIRLNRKVQRFRADAAALAEIEANYQTSGALDVPLVSLHTTGDPIVPVWHQLLYRFKAFLAGSSDQHSAFPIVRYGHCTFENAELVAALALLVQKTSSQPLAGVEGVLKTPAERRIYEASLQAFAQPAPLEQTYPSDLVLPD